MQLYLRPFYNILRHEKTFEWTIEHQKWFEERKNTSHWTNIKYYPRSRHTVSCYVRRLQFWHRRSLITMEQIKWILFQQTEDYLDKLNLDSLHLWKNAQL